MLNSERLTYYPSLESLRGLAALMVAVGHCFIAQSLSGYDHLWETPLWALHASDAITAKLILCVANGTAAVNTFFVISGVVLGLSLDRNGQNFLWKYCFFLVNRIFRIYPAHMFVLLVICAVLFKFHVVNPTTFPHASVWYNWFYKDVPPLKLIVENLFLLDTSLNNVTSTLKVEIVVSCILPILHVVSRFEKYSKVLHASTFSAFLIFAMVYPDSFYLRHLYKFYAGLLVPIYLARIESTRWKYALSSKWIMCPVSLSFLLLAPQLANTSRINELSETIGAVGWIIFAMQRSTDAFWQGRLIKKIGRYSYSFYLWHFPVLWFLYYSLNQTRVFVLFDTRHVLLVTGGMCVASVICAYVLSAISYQKIEKPGISLGKKLLEGISNRQILKT